MKLTRCGALICSVNIVRWNDTIRRARTSFVPQTSVSYLQRAGSVTLLSHHLAPQIICTCAYAYIFHDMFDPCVLQVSAAYYYEVATWQNGVPITENLHNSQNRVELPRIYGIGSQSTENLRNRADKLPKNYGMLQESLLTRDVEICSCRCLRVG